MILDTSALLAIFLAEDEAGEFSRMITETNVCRLSVVSRLELSIVLERKGTPDVTRHAERFLRDAGIVEEPVTLQQGELARQAFYDFGRGRHKASLNFGDCFAYALAKAMREPILFKGNDFARTDLQAARS